VEEKVEKISMEKDRNSELYKWKIELINKKIN
jgi:hypothetical protein